MDREKHLKAEMWDKVQYIFRNYYDRMMHAVLYYEDKLDEKALTEAIRLILDKVPVLHSKFICNPINPYWKIINNYEDKDFFSLVYTNDREEAVNDFINKDFKADSNLQLRVQLIRCDGRDTLCMLVNHMCFDGGDLKYFINKVCEAYNNIKVKNEKYIDIKIGTRDNLQVYNNFNDVDKKIATGLYKNVSAVKNKVVFPFTKADNDYKMIIRHKINAADFTAIKNKGKELNATINDVLLSAYISAIYNLCELKDSDPLTIPSMIDLRRHTKDNTSLGLTNMTGFMLCKLENGKGKDILETLEKVKTALNDVKKDKFIGLYGLPLLKLAFKIMPYFLSETAIRIGYTNPLIGMSNIGIIDDKALIMNGVKLEDGFLTGATKYKPYIQLALTTLRNEVTMTCAVRANDKDKLFIERMFSIIDKELNQFIKKE